MVHRYPDWWRAEKQLRREAGKKEAGIGTTLVWMAAYTICIFGLGNLTGAGLLSGWVPWILGVEAAFFGTGIVVCLRRIPENSN